ncbi:hypothetical protein [Pseudonocardia sp. GCM10023141]|uniref:hypothetical protein n=1 Tax=Pseudonocardia sp. GCM10023141 TaxID=3252653 RepID=UPI00361831DB
MATGSAVVEKTVMDRLIESGITEQRALGHLRNGWVRVDDQVVTDAATPAGWPARVEIRSIRGQADAD